MSSRYCICVLVGPSLDEPLLSRAPRALRVRAARGVEQPTRDATSDCLDRPAEAGGRDRFGDQT